MCGFNDVIILILFYDMKYNRKSCIASRHNMTFETFFSMHYRCLTIQLTSL